MAEKIIACGDALGVKRINELYVQMIMELSEQHDLILDVNEIERIDASALQLIYSYFQYAEGQGKTVKLHQPSEAFIRSAALLGMTESLGL